MKTKMLFLVLAAFFCMNAASMSLDNTKEIHLMAEMADGGSPRSILPTATACLSADNAYILIDLTGACTDCTVSVVNLATGETVCSEAYTDAEGVVLPVAGLLEEGEDYRLVVNMPGMKVYGDFKL